MKRNRTKHDEVTDAPVTGGLVVSSRSPSILHFYHNHKKRRNRLEAARGKNLAHVFSSLRLAACTANKRPVLELGAGEDQPEEAGEASH